MKRFQGLLELKSGDIMKNYGIMRFQNANVENFTSDFGMEFRKKINPFLRKILKFATKGELIIDNYPDLNDKEPYIFVSLHNFVEDTIANLATIDRDAYLLFGTTDQLEVNKEMYFAWLNGFIYVDRYNNEKRKEAILKMERVLENGNSVLIFPEGGFNNTENLLCQKLFSSPYILSKSTNAKVVPIAPFYEFGSDKIYMNVGNPIDLSVYDDKKEALRDLRDTLATLMYNNIEKHSTPIVRSELGNEYRLNYMEQRRLEYLKTKWTKDVWDEELTRYFDQEEREYNQVQESIDNIVITKENARVLAPVLVKRLEDKKYDFKKYMHENWDK